MKRKYAAMMLGLMLTVSSMNVYAADTSNAADTNTEASATDETAGEEGTEADPQEALREEVSGEVKTVDEDTITIAVGTLKEKDNIPGADAAGLDETSSEDNEADTQAAQETDGAAGEEKTAGEENTDEATDETDTETADDTTEASDELRKDTAPEDYSMKKPVEIELTGEEETISVTENTIILREIEGEKMEDVTSYEIKEDPSGDSSDMTEGTDETTDEAEGTDITETTDAAEGTDTTETTDTTESTDTTDVADDVTADASLMKEDVPTEEITLADIKEGDIVAITFDEDGNAETITVISGEESKEAGPKETPEAADEKEDSQGSDETDTSEGTDTTEPSETPDAAETQE